MNEKMGESYLNSINIMGTVLSVFFVFLFILKDLGEKGDTIKLASSILFISYIFLRTFILIIQYVDTKRMFISLYSLSINNKLHPQREYVIIKYDDLFEKKIPFCVNRALFSYRLSKGSKKGVNVKYKIDIDLSISRIRFLIYRFRARLQSRNTIPYFFYIILDSLNEIDAMSNNISVKINYKEKYLFAMHSVTISSEDDMYDKEGLYKVSMELPISFFRLVNNNRVISLEVSYEINNNFEISKNTSEYTFTVIPGNYGKKIKNVNFEVITSIHDNYTINCYEAGVSGLSQPIFEKCLDFECRSSKDAKIYKLLERGYYPNRNSIYCIRLINSKVKRRNQK